MSSTPSTNFGGDNFGGDNFGGDNFGGAALGGVLRLLQLPPCLAGFRSSVVVGLKIVVPIDIGVRPVVDPLVLAVPLTLFFSLLALPISPLPGRSC